MSRGSASGTQILFNGPPKNIYTVSDSLISDREVTLGTFNLNFAISPSVSGRISAGPPGFSPARPIHFKCVDVNPVRISGFNDDASSRALDILNDSNELIAEFYNDSDVTLAPIVGVTTRSRVTIGTIIPASSARFTVQGGNTSVGVPTAVFQNSSSVMAFQIQNSLQVGVGAVGAATERFNIRGFGASSGTHSLVTETSAGVVSMQVRDDRLVQFQTSLDTVNSGVRAYGTVASTSTATQDIHASVSWQHVHAPTVNGTGRSYGAYYRAAKTGTVESFELIGSVGEGFVVSDGDIGPNASAIVAGVRGQARNIANNVEIQNMFAFDGNVLSQSTAGNNATITHFGGLNLMSTSTVNTTITNMYGIRIQDPTSTTGSIVTTTYGVYIEANTLGSSANYGIYQLGATIDNVFQGDVIIGALTPSGNGALVEVSGDLEIIGTPQGLIMEDRTTGLRQRFYLDNGNLEDEAA